MDVGNLRTIALALVLMVVPVASAQDADIDESLPSVGEEAEDQAHVPVVCGPIDAICAVPLDPLMPSTASPSLFFLNPVP